MNLFRRRGLPEAPFVHEVAFLRGGYQLPPGAVRVRTDPMPRDEAFPTRA